MHQSLLPKLRINLVILALIASVVLRQPSLDTLGPDFSRIHAVEEMKRAWSVLQTNFEKLFKIHLSYFGC